MFRLVMVKTRLELLQYEYVLARQTESCFVTNEREDSYVETFVGSVQSPVSKLF